MQEEQLVVLRLALVIPFNGVLQSTHFRYTAFRFPPCSACSDVLFVADDCLI